MNSIQSDFTFVKAWEHNIYKHVDEYTYIHKYVHPHKALTQTISEKMRKLVKKKQQLFTKKRNEN